MAVDEAARVRPRYTPGFVGEGAVGLEQVRREFWRLADYLTGPRVDYVLFEVLPVEPARPRDGMVCCFAAGVVGAGAGWYGYAGGIWTAL